MYSFFHGFPQSHRRQHNKDKPYKCHNCNRGYTDAASLEVHLTTHTVKHAKLYSCGLCNRAYTSVRLPITLKPLPPPQLLNVPPLLKESHPLLLSRCGASPLVRGLLHESGVQQCHILGEGLEHCEGGD